MFELSTNFVFADGERRTAALGFIIEGEEQSRHDSIRFDDCCECGSVVLPLCWINCAVARVFERDVECVGMGPGQIEHTAAECAEFQTSQSCCLLEVFERFGSKVNGGDLVSTPCEHEGIMAVAATWDDDCRTPLLGWLREIDALKQCDECGRFGA